MHTFSTHYIELYSVIFYCLLGDIVIYDTEGHFFVVGRQKELMKYKGFQVRIFVTFGCHGNAINRPQGK